VAEDHAASGADGDRALTPTGRERACAVAETLLHAEEAPVHIVTSPLVRAVQTAEIVAIVTKLGERSGTLEVLRELAPGGDAVALAHRLAHEGKRRVLFAGHEPDLSALVSSLLDHTFGRPFDKSMVVGLQLPSDGSKARLRFVLDAKTRRFEPDHR
jgi:phosphohistidine phosphatase